MDGDGTSSLMLWLDSLDRGGLYAYWNSKGSMGWEILFGGLAGNEYIRQIYCIA